MKKFFAIVVLMVTFTISSIIPVIALTAEYYCPMFKPEVKETWNRVESKWEKEEHMNTFLLASMVIAIGGTMITGIMGTGIILESKS